MNITNEQPDYNKEINNDIFSKFWKESSELIDYYRKNGDERAAEGVVSCRILINRLFNGK